MCWLGRGAEGKAQLTEPPRCPIFLQGPLKKCPVKKKCPVLGHLGWLSWVNIWTLGFTSGHDLMSHGIKPWVGLHAQQESA